MSRLSLLISLRAAVGILALLAAGCSSSKKDTQTFAAGEKATVGPLVYSVIDTQVLTQLGDDAATARTPENRFYVMTISASNSGAEDMPVPGLTLVDDSGVEYPEIADGSGVSNWLGIVRKVGAAQTEQGNILFDAPAKHYKLRFTDDTDDKQIYIDVPLTYVHEQMRDVPSSVPTETPTPDLSVPKNKK